MADYNPNTVAAYQQYASSMSSGGGGSNMSGLGAKTTGKVSSKLDDKGFTPTKSTSTASGVAYTEKFGDDDDNIPKPPTQIYTAAAEAATQAGSVFAPQGPMANAINLYSMPNMVEAASDYVYRADRDETIREAISESQQEEQAQVDAAIKSINMAITQGKTDEEIAEAFFNDMGGMGSDKPDELGGYGVPGMTIVDVTDTGEGALSNPQPLYDFAEEMANPTITRSELPPMTPEEQASLGEAIRKAAEDGTLQSKLSNIQFVRSDGDRTSPSFWDRVFAGEAEPETEEVVVEAPIETTASAASNIPENIDLDFLGAAEGYELEAYVPEKKDGTVFGKSGVTVGTGVDLGSKNKEYFEGLDPNIEGLFAPYYGKTKKAAQDALKEFGGFTLTDAQAKELDTFVKAKQFNDLKDKWNKSSDTKWEDLTEEQATVVASVAYQYGNLAKETPNFWKQTTEGRWQDAYENLMDFGDDYNERREIEAELLRSGMRETSPRPRLRGLMSQ